MEKVVPVLYYDNSKNGSSFPRKCEKTAKSWLYEVVEMGVNIFSKKASIKKTLVVIHNYNYSYSNWAF